MNILKNPLTYSALLFTLASCYNDEFNSLNDKIDQVSNRVDLLSTVNTQITELQSALNNLVSDSGDIAKLQSLLEEVNALSTTNGADLVAIQEVLSTVEQALSSDLQIQYGIDSLDNFLTMNSNSIIQLGHKSISPKASNFFELKSGFEDVKIHTLLTSEDNLPLSPDFVYGSMADGAGLLKNGDGSFTLINNIEADYSVARITFDRTFKPVMGEYILNAEASANTAQCSGSLITPEVHGFGPLYLSGGEWGGAKKGVYAMDPYKKSIYRGQGNVLPALGEWSTENAVALPKEAYANKTVIFIGDDNSDNSLPQGQLGMYYADRGDLSGGKLYGLKVTTANIDFEMDMKEGVSYDFEMVELEERTLTELNAEAMEKGVMGFSRLEDIDWRRGSAANNREIYFAVTGRKKDGLKDKGTFYGRIYKVTLDADSPLSGKISPVLDGDKLDGIAKSFHSPDNILVTENYAYIQEDPNGYPDTADKSHYAYLYQYNLNTGDLKVVLECDQVKAASIGYGTENSTWEITGMIDISDEISVPETFLMITQNHGWVPADGTGFTDPKAVANFSSHWAREGSMLFLVNGLKQ